MTGFLPSSGDFPSNFELGRPECPSPLLFAGVVFSGAVKTTDASAGTGLPRAAAGWRWPAFGRAGTVLAELFPEARPLPRRLPRSLIVAIYVLSVAAGTLLMLARYVNEPPWQSIYAEDYPVFLVPALAHPWHSLLESYAGYLQLVPRIIGLAVSQLPIRAAAAGFAIIGAAVAAACALFVFHASSGLVRNPLLRVLLGLSVLLLPVALLEIADCGVNTPWYLEMALFWALLWRPPSWAGAVLAAVIGFASASSNITASVFVILVIIRIIALPRVREHVVSIGWALGCLTQVPYFLTSTSASGSRLSTLATPAQSTGFYGHDVVLPAFGWHLSWVLRHWWDRDTALILVGGILVLIVAAVLIAGTTRVRLFTVTALGFGFVFTIFAATVTYWVTTNKIIPSNEPGARYTCLPIVLITAVLIVATDAFFVSAGRRAVTVIVATVALIGVLCIGWIPDFRYVAQRNQAPLWAPVAAQWLATCQHHDSIRYEDGYFKNEIFTIPCSRIR